MPSHGRRTSCGFSRSGIRSLSTLPGDREAHPVLRGGLRVHAHGRGHAYHLAGVVQKRPTRVAEVQGGVGLDHVGYGASQDAGGALPLSTDHPDGDGAQPPVRAAHRDRHLAGPDLVRVRKRPAGRYPSSSKPVDANDGEVVGRARSHRLGVQDPAVAQPDSNARRSLDDVVVGHHVPHVVNQEAGAGAWAGGNHVASGDDDLEHRGTHGVDDGGHGLLVVQRRTGPGEHRAEHEPRAPAPTPGPRRRPARTGAASADRVEARQVRPAGLSLRDHPPSGRRARRRP